MTIEIGIPEIMPNVKKPVASYSKSAKHSAPPMPAWWIFPAGSQKVTGYGQSGRSLDMPIIGYRKKEVPMETPVALGFLMLLLNENQRKVYLATMKRLGRRITPYEAYVMFPELSRKKVEEPEELRMATLWNEFYKISKGANGIYELTAEMTEKWGSYVKKTYVEPLPDVAKQGWDA